MQVELVQTVTVDALRLDGAVHPAAAPRPAGGIDAWLCLHGTGSNFYASSLLASLAPRLAQSGAHVLVANTRGHDLAYQAATAAGRTLLGAAFERVEHARWDISAWLRLLIERGWQGMGLLGHSLGAIKAIYAQVHDAPRQVRALVAVSPPRLSYSHFRQGSKAAEFEKTFAAAEALVQAGQPQAVMEVTFPLPYLVSAGGYVDRYGPAETYNVLKLVGKVSCPALVSYGTRELADVAFSGMPEALDGLRAQNQLLRSVVVEGADHNYTGVVPRLAEAIERWLQQPDVRRT